MVLLLLGFRGDDAESRAEVGHSINDDWVLKYALELDKHFHLSLTNADGGNIFTLAIDLAGNRWNEFQRSQSAGQRKQYCVQP